MPTLAQAQAYAEGTRIDLIISITMLSLKT